MASRKKIGIASFGWAPLTHSLRGQQLNDLQAVNLGRSKFRYGNEDYLSRVERIFDPELGDLSSLNVGYFDTKIWLLPRSRVPSSRSELLSLCRQIVDHGQDQAHIDLMLKYLPEGIDLDQHVQTLWDINEDDPDLFSDVVRGIHGRAIRRHKRRGSSQLSKSQFKGVLARQAILLCAMDVQMAIVGARVVDSEPYGEFMEGNSRPVGGTALRLMRETAGPIEETQRSFQAVDDIQQRGRLRTKLAAKSSKIIAHQGRAGQQPGRPLIRAGKHPLSESKLLRHELDNRIHEVSTQMPVQILSIDHLAKYNIGNGIGQPKIDNTHRTFHQIWYSDLTSLQGAAVSLLRFAMAEEKITSLVDDAYGRSKYAVGNAVFPIGPPSPDLDRQPALAARVFDLFQSARRAQLKDANFASRTPKEHRVPYRDPDDKAGLKPIMRALEFLQVVGQRSPYLDPSSPKTIESDRQETYFHLDVIPEVRLNMLAEPNLSFLE